jgi:hypothetical protein
MMNVKLHSLTAEFITAKLFSYLCSRWGTDSQDCRITPNTAWEEISTQSVAVYLISSASTKDEVISGWSLSAVSVADYVLLVEVFLQSQLQITCCWLKSFCSLSYRLRVAGWSLSAVSVADYVLLVEVFLQSHLHITCCWLQSLCSLSCRLQVTQTLLCPSQSTELPLKSIILQTLAKAMSTL